MPPLDRDTFAEKAQALERHLGRVARRLPASVEEFRPASDADAFQRLADAGVLESGLARRLRLAAGFRNVVAHGYDQLELTRVWRVAREGPPDLRAFLAVVRDRL